ncbi:MAG: SDR family oxidoreductase [Lentimicrobium sp.]
MNILITGVSKGLGLEITRTLLSDNHKVFGVSRSVTGELKSLMAQYPDSLFIKTFDLERVEEVKSLFSDEFLGYHVQLHGFVNNAAAAYDDIITNLNLDQLDRMFRINVYTPMMLTKLVIRNMLLNRISGSIVHISSISVHTGYKGLAMYAASKGALEAFSKNTAREWGERGIRSNCVVAGFMETNMSSTLSAEQKDRIYKRTSLKVPVDLGSVANTVSFLLNDGSKSVTGQNIHVDAGTI